MMSDDCNSDQTCLNTRGSYLCLPTPCPDNYERDEMSGQCVQLCSHQANKTCSEEGATTAQTISYTVLSLRSVSNDVPILKLVNYDINRTPLDRTDFTFEGANEFEEAFMLESLPNKRGIVYLYALQGVKTDRVYKLKIVGRSREGIDDKGALSYVTKFFIYVYMQ